MRKIIIPTIIAVFATVAATSCYDDKGSYDYSWTDLVSINLDHAPAAVGAGTRLYLEPELKTVQSSDYNLYDTLDNFRNPDRYSYLWEARSYSNVLIDTLSTERILDVDINLAISSTLYYIFLTVTDTSDGVAWTNFFALTVTDSFIKGLVMLYEDEEGAAEMDIWGTTPDYSDSYYQRRALSASGFPARGKPYFTLYYGGRIYVGTDQDTGWISTPSFEWRDSYMAAIIRMGAMPQGYTYSWARLLAGLIYFGTSDGDIAFKNSISILPTLNLLIPEVSGDPSAGKYQQVEFAPYAAGSNQRQYIWDLTNKRMMRVSGYSMSAGTDVPQTLSEAEAFNGHDMIYMRNTTAGSKFSAILKSPDGDYKYITFEASGANFTLRYSVTHPNTNGMFDRAELIEFSSGLNPATYVYADNRLWVSKESGFVETNVRLSAGEVITKILVPYYDHAAHNVYGDRFLICVYDENAGEGKVLVYSTNYITPEELTLENTISGTPRITDMTLFY